MDVIDLNEIRKINYSMLCEIDDICKKNNIKYFLHGGTLLGMERHKDFIPWDDDVDIAFLRKDYEKFLIVFSNECSANLMLINHREYPEFLDFIDRVIYKNITIDNSKIDNDFYKLRYSHPSVDLFVYDDCFKFYNFQLLLLHFVYALSMGHRKKIDYSKYKGIYKLGAYVIPSFGRLFSMRKLSYLYDKISKMGDGNSGYLFISNEQAFHTSWGIKYPKIWYKKTSFGRIRERKFPCPCSTKKYLKMIYGNYTSLPPISQRKPEHFNFIYK